MITQKYLKQLVIYDPETGIFTWKLRPLTWFPCNRTGNSWNSKYAGQPAGAIDGKGYLHIKVLGKWERLHRLAFLYMEGFTPPGEVDHKDHDRLNNKWDNLRSVDVSTNRKNQSLNSKNTSGVNGIYINQRVKHIAQIKSGFENIYLG